MRKAVTRELSACETLIMKVVWDAKEDIAVQELIVQLKEQYGKDYARTTVVTFLGKMADKGFVSTHRRGKNAFVHAEKNEDAYKSKLLSLTQHLRSLCGLSHLQTFSSHCSFCTLLKGLEAIL